MWWCVLVVTVCMGEEVIQRNSSVQDGRDLCGSGKIPYIYYGHS